MSTGDAWPRVLSWLGAAMILLTGMVPALAGGERIRARKLGVIPWRNEFCVMGGSIYLYDGEAQTLVRYRVGKEGLSEPERPIRRLPCAPWTMGCGHGRIVGWCGDPRVERDGFEWKPETGKVREFDWPWPEVVSLQVVPDGLVVLTKEKLYRWEIGQDPGEADVLYAAPEEVQLVRFVVNHEGTRVALQEYDMRGLMAGRREEYAYVVALELSGGRAKVVGRYGAAGVPVGLTGDVLWGWHEKPWEVMEPFKTSLVREGSPNPVRRRQAPWGLLAEDWRTGTVLASWGTDLKITARNDGEEVIAMVTPLLKWDPVDVYELTVDVEQRRGDEGSKESNLKR